MEGGAGGKAVICERDKRGGGKSRGLDGRTDTAERASKNWKRSLTFSAPLFEDDERAIRAGDR